MTREEALKIWLPVIAMGVENMPELEEALEMAIKALEQEPCEDAISRSDMLDTIGHGTTYTSEDLQGIIKGLPSVNPQPCEDAISRQDVLDLAKKGVLVSNGNYESVCKAINELPPVNPQPKTGHWIEKGNQVACSNCDFSMRKNLHRYWMRYCTKCGAKMENILFT